MVTIFGEGQVNNSLTKVLFHFYYKKLMSQLVDRGTISYKKIYESILSAKQPNQQLALDLDHLIKNSLNCTQHLNFLLHRVNWFELPFSVYTQRLFKIFRLYRACYKQSSRVIINLVIEGFFSPLSHPSALKCLIQLFGEAADHQIILSALRENYPHKLCSQQIHSNYISSLLQLAQTYPRYRTDFLEIAIENLTKFDTEVLSGDDWVHRPFPQDQAIVSARDSSGGSELALKLDDLLEQLFAYFSYHKDDESLMNEILLIFQNKVLPIKTTKNIQLLVFFLAEQNRRNSHFFISFLLGNLFEKQLHQNRCRLFAQSSFYLFSYLLRSRTITPKILQKTFLILVKRLQDIIDQFDAVPIDERSDLKQLLQERESPLLVLQTIIMIKLGSSSLNRPDVNQIFYHLMKESRSKLHFQFFLRHDILEKIEFAKPARNSLRLKFSNKFLPSTLQKTGKILDPLMTLSLDPVQGEHSRKIWKGDEKEVRRQSLHKGQTPISYCSETVV